jgi:sugar lactone lactonase YvrE
MIDETGVITTIAGTGIPGFDGDNGTAEEAQLNKPKGICVDAAGNIFVADTYNHRIRKIDNNGMMTTIAGTGGSGFSGDNGLATNAQLYYPSGLDIDDSGNLYISDTYNHRIRKIDASGLITTIAGTGSAGVIGDGGLALDAEFNLPHGVKVDDSGVLYIADSYNHRVRRMGVDGVITTIAGDGIPRFFGDEELAIQASLSTPLGVDVDEFGNIYISDTGNNRLRRVDTMGVINTISGEMAGFRGDGGLAVEALLNQPSGIFVNTTGDLFVSDYGNHRIRKIEFREPQSIVFDPILDQMYGDSIYLSAQGGESRNPVVFSSTTPEFCSISGNFLKFIGIGKCKLTVNQEGDEVYFPAEEVINTFSINRKVLSLQNITTHDKIYDGLPFALIENGEFQGELIEGDDLSFKLGEATFENINAGIGIPIQVSGSTLRGRDSAKYELTEVEGLTADILPRDLEITLNDTIIEQFEEGIKFSYSLQGFIDGEERDLEDVVFLTEMNGMSEAGFYPISLKAKEFDNYVFLINDGEVELISGPTSLIPQSNLNYDNSIQYGIYNPKGQKSLIIRTTSEREVEERIQTLPRGVYLIRAN